ncbi:C2 domain [Phytophthora cinnamomi]|uniref:C2 domain n=1 Tax=Phytophthora cinnamomi TaxID=4785 RepID=UPI003559B436|nr:C2 domain [Phytophthora cinnamomi]
MERFASSKSIGLAGWGNPTLPQSGFTLFLRVHSARNLAAVGRGSYCKLYLGNTELVSGSTQGGASFSNLLAADHAQQQQVQVQQQQPTHRVFRTKVLYTDQKTCPEWNEKLELHVLNPETEILTIRVKNQLMLFCPAIGACAIPLANVRLGEPAEQWFPLHKGDKPAGHIRLQLLLTRKDPSVAPPPAVSESPMQRLIQQHCQQERDRRQQQQSDESMRRQQFEEQERAQAELRRQREEAEERERRRIEGVARMQAIQDQIQREEQAKVQAYLQKQMQHEDTWQADVLVDKMDAMKVEDAPEEATKETGNGGNYYFADDMVTASIRSSTSSAGMKQSFTAAQEGNCEEVAEAVELTDIAFGEVVHDALPSSDSTSSDGRSKRHKEKERRKKHSRTQARSVKEDRSRRSQAPLFPSAPGPEHEEETHRRSLSPASSSFSDESSSSSEEERRWRRRRRKEKKAKRKERRRRRKAKRKARRQSDGYESSSSSSSSSSSYSSSSDERRKRKAKKHKKTKERARSQREGKASTMPRGSAPPHSNSYGPDHSSYSKESKYSGKYSDKYSDSYNKYGDTPFARPAQSKSQSASASPPGYIETLPPQPQQKRSMGEMISTASDVASILSNVASVATSVQQLAGGGNTGGGAGGLNIPFAVPDMSQFLGGQGVTGLVGQDSSGVVGSDTTAQYF